MSVLALSAFGDALGVPYEFREQALLPGEAPTMVARKHKLLEEFGEWSDDNSMALCIAMAARNHDLRSEEGLDLVGKLYLKWSREYPAGIGGQTRQVLAVKGDTSYRELRARAADYFEKNPDRAAGNGSLMRIHPVSLLPYSREELARVAVAVTEMTHADPRCLQSSILWTEMLRVARETGELDPFAGMELIPEHAQPWWYTKLDHALKTESAVFGTLPWWVLPAHQQALSAVYHTYDVKKPNPFEVFTEIISCTSCDADTICAIAGGLMGALGAPLAALPQSEVELAHGLWPRRATLSDLEELEAAISKK